MPASAASASVKHLRDTSWVRDAAMVAPARLNGSEFGKVYEFPRSPNTATAREAQEVSYPDRLLAIFAASLTLFAVAALLGVVGWFAENDNVTYWGMAAAVLGALSFIYSAKRAKQLIS